MRLAPDGTLRLSPSDLANHLACAHLTQLELRVQRGELVRPLVVDPYGQIIMRKGNEHEAAYLARLVDARALRDKPSEVSSLVLVPLAHDDLPVRVYDKGPYELPALNAKLELREVRAREVVGQI